MEKIRVNRRHKDTIEMQTAAKLIVTCNSLPNITDTSDGFWRRLIVIIFFEVVPIDQVNPTLVNELIDELSGILNWAMRGLARLQENERFTECSVCQQALAEHRRTCDSVTEFFAQCCRRDETIDAHSQRLYEVYSFFCKERGRKPASEPEFGKRMKLLGLEKRKARPTEDVGRPYLYRSLVLTEIGHDWMDRYLKRGDTGWDNLHYEILDPVDPIGPGAVQEESSHSDGANSGEVNN
jgi:putative DNA primase/helicase